MKTAPSAAMVLLLVGAMYTQPIRVEVQPGAEFRFRSARERPPPSEPPREGWCEREGGWEERHEERELGQRCRWIANLVEWHDCFASLR